VKISQADHGSGQPGGLSHQFIQRRDERR
jgi:hypothetical protein